MKPTAASGVQVEMARPEEWRQAGDWEPWPRAWNRMELNCYELALLTALISASFSEGAEIKEEIRLAAGLPHKKFNDAIVSLEGRGLMTRRRTAVRGNGVTWRLHREPVPEDKRTGKMPPPKKPRSRNADRLKQNGSADGRPSAEATTDAVQQNSSSGDVRMGVHPQTDVRMDVHPPATDGRPSALPIQMSSDSSSSVGSSSTTEVEPGRGKEEEASEEAETNSQWEPVARELVGGVRFKPGRYLMREARERVVELLIGHLEAGHQPSWLGKRLNEWGNEAKNPSTYFVERLEGLGPPRPKLTVVADQQPERDQDRDPDAADETSEALPSSPVTWLSDAQFTQLPQYLRAAVRTIGEQPESELRPIAQTWYASIRASLGSEEIADKGA